MPLAFAAFLIGLVFGSFLNVVIHRVPAGESIVSPASRCPRCHSKLRPRDNIPVLSWLVLRGRCRSCREPIAFRYPAVELLTASVFALSALRIGFDPALPAFLVFSAALIAVAVIDLETRTIPKRIVWPTTAAGALLLTGAALIEGDPTRVLLATAGALAAFFAFFLIHLVSPRGLGFGDVRLSALLGLFLGWLGWGYVALGLFAGFLLGSLAGVIALLRGSSRKSALPFGPFMAVGALLTIWFGGPLIRWYLGGL